MGSTSGSEEYQEEGPVAFWIDNARFAELLVFIAFCMLLLRLVLQLVTAKSQQQRTLTQLSRQSLVCYAVVAVVKTVQPRMWRFHEAGFLDKYTAVACSLCAVLSLRLAELGAPVDAFGAQLIALITPLQSWGRCRRIAELSVLPLLVMVLAYPIDVCRPRDLQIADEDQGVMPLQADVLSVLDTVAILPQFALFYTQKQKQKYGGTAVSPIVGTWLGLLGLARLFSFISGVTNLVEDGYEFHKWNMIEVFYCVCSGINILLISDFQFYWVRSWLQGDALLVLPE